jgi:hypothetical protein
MAHYAYLDENNVVTHVIVGRDEHDRTGGVTDWEEYYGAKRCSYNTFAGQHSKGGVPFRKNYPGPGWIYDEARDAFKPAQPFPSWTLNEETCLYDPPIPYPSDGEKYSWNEGTQSWDLFVPPEV